MIEFISWGETLIEGLSYVGRLVLVTPLKTLTDNPELMDNINLPNWLIRWILNLFGDLSIGMMLFSTGLLGIILFKLIKFFIGIIP